MDPNDITKLQGDINNQAMPNMSSVTPQPVQVDSTIEPQPQLQPMQPMQVDDVEGKRARKKNKTIIFASLGIGLVIVAAVLAIVLPKIFANNPIVGEWDCYKYSWSGDVTDEPVNKLILNMDGSFTYGSYNDLNNNHFAGRTYEYEEKGKDDASGFVSYMVEFGPTTEFVVNGVKQDSAGRQMSDIEIAVGVENGKKEAFIMLEDNYSMYLCTAE